MALRERQEARDDGVSPVVGMILVLGISIVGIAAILYWGLPAIDEMKANVEHRSVESQFQELDATIKELVAGTTEKTAKRWQPTLNRGAVNVVNETEGFVYAVEPVIWNRNHSFIWSGLGDGDNSFRVYSKNDSIAVGQVKAYRINSTTSSEELRVNDTGGTGQRTNIIWTANSAMTFTLRDTGGNVVNIRNTTIKFQVYDGSTKIGEAFFVPTGRVDYRLEAGVAVKTVSQNNGAVITGNGDTYAFTNSPPIPPAANTSGITRHFARAVVLNGTTSFAGDDRFDVLVTLYSTYTLASYDCSKADRSDCVENVKVFAFGKYATTWYNYLSAGRGYSFVPLTDDGMTYLFDREGWMGYTLLQSTVQLTG